MPYFALFDDALSGRARLLEDWQHTDFLSAAELDTLDARLTQGWAQGWHCALWADYEFGLPLLGLPDEGGRLALHWFARAGEVSAEDWLAGHDNGRAGISTPTEAVGQARYLADIAQVQEAIARGDTYQINYTTRLHLNAYGCPISLYRRLRQPVPYAALACLPDHAAAERWTLCFSPELFLRIRPGRIETEPMKGTAPFVGDGQDDARAAALQADPKNRAENVMIVDLLRNDLSKLARTGGVRVPEPFKVSRFGSVWQMTSRIEADVPPLSAADIFRAAFPCGSITGAPKRMSMEIIRRLECAGRGLYTGSIGFLNPEAGGAGFSGVLNVVIRTLTLGGAHNGIREGVYGVGSGIVSDSDALAEYRECGWKARFLNELRPDFGVFETLRVENGRCALLSRHTGRLKNAALALNLPWQEEFDQQIAAAVGRFSDGLYRCKITLNAQGLSFAHSPFSDFQTPQSVLLADAPADAPYLRRFKTDLRQDLDALWQATERAGAFDTLFFDRSGRLLEGARSNVFVKSGGRWLTPSAALPILNGVMRQAVLGHPRFYLDADQVIECDIDRQTLENAEEIRLSNALRGLFRVSLKSHLSE